jgi:hypothetical protein
MTGTPHHYPPPGAPLPEEPAAPRPGGPPPGSPGPPPPQQYRPPTIPGMLGAAHKPGAIPLRPLTLGNLYDGAFRIIRFNPKATVGAAALVSAVAMVLPIVISTITAFTVGSGFEADGDLSEDASTAELVGLLGSFGSFVLGLFAAQVGVIFVTGMIAHVARAAAVGRRITLAEAWAATHGKRWRLLGQALLIGVVAMLAVALVVALIALVAVLSEDVLLTVLVAIALVLGSIPLSIWLWIKVVYLSTPTLMLEPVGVFGSFGRNWRLTANQFWRILGISLLTALVTGVAGYVLGLPTSIGGNIGGVLFPEYFLLILVLSQAIGLIIQNAFVAPFTAAVTSLMYLDQRMRKEAYDVELMREAGLIPQ